MLRYGQRECSELGFIVDFFIEIKPPFEIKTVQVLIRKFDKFWASEMVDIHDYIVYMIHWKSKIVTRIIYDDGRLPF